MFLLPPFLRQFIERVRQHDKPRIFLRDDQLVLRLQKIAVDQRRPEQEVYDDVFEAGMQAIQVRDEYADLWDTLSQREQQVTALICLGYRSYEIADMLGISYETVRTHSKHIYAKFGMGRKQLRLALKDWEFQRWLESENGAGS